MPNSPASSRGGRSWRRLSMLAVSALFLVSGGVRGSEEPAAGVETALTVLRAVGPEGTGNREAGEAWRTIAQADAAILPRLLDAMNGAAPVPRNYLSTAGDFILERALRDGGEVPLAGIGEFVLETRHDPAAREAAFDLLLKADGITAEALISGLLDDPAPGLRRHAVERLVATADARRNEDRAGAATVLYQQALGFAREADQIERILEALEALGRPGNLVVQLGFLTNWMVIGPFDNSGGAGFEQVFPPEERVDLQAEYAGRTGTVRWKPFASSHSYGMVDMNKALAPLKEVAAYAYTEVVSELPRQAELRLGSKNGWKLWFNGQYVFGRDEYHRAAEIDQYRFPVQLKAGTNSLLVKVTQNDWVEEWSVEWEFQLRVTDPAGRVIRSAAPWSASLSNR